ncbi:MAG: TetR/AcrR family transcriptional regulator [Chloroflexi bacterium]|nr:TetR/AcrR family transcriptional regulator [Chloroflexota bacterium]
MMQNSGVVEVHEDLRVRRTRKMLVAAFMELTVEKGFAAVTVRDITDRAMVNRSTFYRHFLDKYDLLDQYMTDVYGSASDEKLAEEKVARKKDFAPPGLTSLLKHIQEFPDFYRVMLGAQGDPKFIDRFRKNSERRLRALLEYVGDGDPNGSPIELRLSYASCAGIGVILWWLENNQPCTVEQLAVWLSQLTGTSVGLAIKPTQSAQS